MKYYNNGKTGELDFCKLMDSFNSSAKLTSNLDLQYKDIDCILRDGRTVSVKDQSQADKFKCFLFEKLQVRTEDGANIKGNIFSCQADLYAICSPTTWFILDAPKLKTFLSENTFKEIRTTCKTEAFNRKYKGIGCYDRTFSYVVSYKALEESNAFLWKGTRI